MSDYKSIQNEGIIFSRKLTSIEFQRLIFEELLDFFKLIRIKESIGNDFEKREPTELIQFFMISELYSEAEKQLNGLINNYPNLKPVIGDKLYELIKIFKENDNNAFILLNSYMKFSEVKKSYLNELDENKISHILLKADQYNVYIENDDEFLKIKVDLKDSFIDNIENKKFLSSMMSICKDVRNNEREFSQKENSAVWFAYSLIKKGVTLDFSYRGIGTSGFRKNHQTLIFSTDPGADHIRITSMSNQLMDGVAVHVEHIDRDKINDKEKVEPYRLPAAINAAKVRLHISNDAPVTAFIGRPVFENGSMDIEKNGYISSENYKIDKLKSVHIISSACTAMFQNGVADCKIAIERMESSDCIKFMKSVVGNVIRDNTRQTLAAAININTPIFDDKYTKNKIDQRFEIAKLGIKIVSEGGFDRVTWDGADSINVPSLPIIDQMSHKEFVELVHIAHENGLQTYFSAGLKAEHVERCVITGVDGLGIGTSLHYIDKNTHLMGAFDPDAINEVLKARNKAEVSDLGKAAILLAKLDRLFFEKIIYEEENNLRIELYNAVLEQNVENAKSLFNDSRVKRVKELNYEEENTVIGRAQRTLNYYKEKKNNKMDFTREEENKYIQIKKAVIEKDLKRLQMIFQEI